MNAHDELSQLSAYLDGELEPSARSALEAHLPSCAECSSTLAGLQATLTDLRALGEAEPTEQQIWTMRSTLAQARRTESKRGARIMAAGGIAAAIVAITAVVLSRPSPHQASTADTFAGGAEFAMTASAPLVMSNDTNYTAQNARDVFLLVNAPVVASVEMQDSGATVPSAAGARAQKAAPLGQEDAASEAAAQEAMTACDTKVVRPSQQQAARAVLYLSARYGGKDAYFMVYEVPADSPARRELWILEPGSCRVLRYEQQNI